MACVVVRRRAWRMVAAGLLLTGPLVHAEELATRPGEQAAAPSDKAARFDGDSVIGHARAWASISAANAAEPSARDRGPAATGQANILAEATGEFRRLVEEGGVSADDYNRFAAALGTDPETRAKVESLLRGTQSAAQPTEH